uniref:Uncharacterized protein n=1 Tax=Caldisericum exile TaxID=693075 RepID=A0A7C4U118_9BACT
MKHEFKLEEELCIISRYTLDTLFKKCSDAVTLYLFYYYTAKWQKTNQPKATPSYCKKGLGWGDIRFERADKVLRELGLVEKIADKNEKGQIVGWYVRLNYIWSKEKTKSLGNIKPEPMKTRGVENPYSGEKSINALNVNNINALNVNNNNVEIQRIYDFFISSFGKNPNQYKLTPYRKQKIKLRLKDAGEEMLKQAITNTANSPFHRGDNDRGWQADLDFIIRSYEQVERLANMKPKQWKYGDQVFDNEQDYLRYKAYKEKKGEL